MKKNLYLAVLSLFIALPVSHSAQAEKIYSVGVVPQFEARRINEIWQPILEEVSQQSGIKLELKASSSIPVFEKQLAAGEFDFAYMNPYHAIVSNEEQGYAPLLRDTGRSLYGVIVVKQDSPIQSVKELDGKIVAFPSPNALGAALLPRAELARKFNIEIEELYVKSHSSVYLNVLLDKAVAGGGVQKTLSQQPEKIRNQLRILHKTERLPPHPITAHPRVASSVQSRVSAAFIQMDNSETGKDLLKMIPMKKIGEASILDYESLKKLGLHEYYVAR
ncbi:MAG: phosphate/phosphite/phosphonate ABC transporter substrate-binding protein [Gammaproteobacteria bacterium]|nr:phosphate/phosphite/phosphonate ABC transporter substrate-binding protein [Gammaproteobacteria bacterium]MBT8133005.1 phosphate/phosphite/phosphonate ABC transporter substrate-binding protein [Gammaproteobacteria bacterium]NNJ50081.1 phosphate/phosphite/phosphonate ABC transporter substrate-binding protein [Gammaproteobacteria bacterium]